MNKTLVVIGNFDGVHLGHQAVLRASAVEAGRLGLRSVVLTFDPHPALVLGRSTQRVLTSLDRKIELIRRIEPAIEVAVEPFTLELSRVSPESFAKDLLQQKFGARVVVVGQNFRFGHQRAGDFAGLVEIGKKLGFEARAEVLVGDAEGPYSSTRVRSALANGDLSGAELLLGRPHAISGVVVHGDGRGRSIGVPTANLSNVEEALPPYGVYACVVDELRAEGPRALASGVANIGVRPTVAAGFSIEVHLFDRSDDLYEKKLRVHLVARLREERKFSGIQELVAQIHRDMDAARAATRELKPLPAAEPAWA